LRSDNLADASDLSISRWEAFCQEHSPPDPMHDPQWLKGYFEDQVQNVIVYSVYRGDRLAGIAPFLKKRWPVALYLGHIRVAELPLMRLRMLGSALEMPPDEAAYDLLFSELARIPAGFDALYMDGVPVESFLWKYLQTSRVIKRLYSAYQPDPPTPHLLLQVQGTFNEYMAMFSARHRHNLKRRVSKFREEAPAEVKWVRYTKPEEVSLFLESAVAISRQTYQWKLFQRGLSATDLLRKRLTFAAENGWFRSYLLFAGETPCAFVTGFQYNERFLHHEIGYDPAWRKYAVGTVLQMYMIEDLFTYNRPDVLDLGDYGVYKEEIANDSYVQGKLFLFKRGVYNWFVQASHSTSQAATRKATALLDRFDLSNKVRQRARAGRGLH
jgi:hypothetical protein